MNNANRFESEHLTGRAVLARCIAGETAIGYVSAAVGVDYDATARVCPMRLRLELVIDGRRDVVDIPAAECDGRTFEAIVCQTVLAGQPA